MTEAICLGGPLEGLVVNLLHSDRIRGTKIPTIGCDDPTCTKTQPANQMPIHFQVYALTGEVIEGLRVLRFERQE